MNNVNVKQIEDWILEINEINTEKGWRVKGLEICDFAANLHGEISEAFEDYRNNKGINEVWYEYSNGYGVKYEYENKYLSLSDDRIILGKPCGIPSELSDIVIRSLDMIGYYGWEDDFIEEYKEKNDEFEINLFKEKKFTSKISDMHQTVSQMYYFEKTDNQKYKAIFNLDYLIKKCFLIAEQYEIDIIEQINDKIAYNRTRPARHGGKRV